MFEYTVKTTKSGAKFALIVTVIALWTSACGHRPVDGESAEMMPIPANEVVPTPEPMGAPAPVEQAPAVKKRSKFKIKRGTRVVKSKKSLAHRIAKHKVKSKKALAAARVQEQRPLLPPPSAPAPVLPAADQASVNHGVDLPVPPMPLAIGSSDNAASNAWIWALAAVALVAGGVVGTRAYQRSRGSRRLILNG